MVRTHTATTECGCDAPPRVIAKNKIYRKNTDVRSRCACAPRTPASQSKTCIFALVEVSVLCTSTYPFSAALFLSEIFLCFFCFFRMSFRPACSSSSINFIRVAPNSKLLACHLSSQVNTPHTNTKQPPHPSASKTNELLLVLHLLIQRTHHK